MAADTVTCAKCLKEIEESERCEGCYEEFCPACWEIHVASCNWETP